MSWNWIDELFELYNTSNGRNQSNQDIDLDIRIQRPIPTPQSRIHAKKGKAITSRYMNTPRRNPVVDRNQVG